MVMVDMGHGSWEVLWLKKCFQNNVFQNHWWTVLQLKSALIFGVASCHQLNFQQLYWTKIQNYFQPTLGQPFQMPICESEVSRPLRVNVMPQAARQRVRLTSSRWMVWPTPTKPWRWPMMTMSQWHSKGWRARGAESCWSLRWRIDFKLRWSLRKYEDEVNLKHKTCSIEDHRDHWFQNLHRSWPAKIDFEMEMVETDWLSV